MNEKNKIYKKCTAFEPGHKYEIKSELIKDSGSSHLKPLVDNPFVFKGNHPCMTCSLKVIKDTDSLADYRWIREDDKKEFYSWDNEIYTEIFVFAHQCVELLAEDTKQVIIHHIKKLLFELNNEIMSDRNKNTLKDITGAIEEKVNMLEDIVYNKEMESK